MKNWITTTAVRWILPLLLTFVLFSAARAGADAEATYKAKCAGCHGADGAGTTASGKAMKARDFHSPEVQKETGAEMTEIVNNGKNKMPKYAGKLTDAEVKELVEYVRALGKK